MKALYPWIIYAVFLTFFLSFAYPTFAQGDWDSIIANCVEGGVATLRCIPAVFKNLIYWALVFAGIVAVFFIIYSGFKYVNSGGDPKQVEGAKQTLTWAIIGLIIILSSFFIITIITRLTGTACIELFGFTACP